MAIFKSKTTKSIVQRIKVIMNGPYLVSGKIPLMKKIIGIDQEGDSYEWREAKHYPTQETYSLCRCGQSKKKPFCDGTHIKVNFDGTETSNHSTYLDQAKMISGPNMDLTDARVLCAAARFCDRAGGIWKLIKESDNPESRAIAEEEAKLCPSGRLVAWTKDGKAIESEFEPSIVVVEDPQENMEGPIWVRGGIPIESSDGYVYEIRNRVALCRCGKSANKPFCDASHCHSNKNVNKP